MSNGMIPYGDPRFCGDALDMLVGQVGQTPPGMMVPNGGGYPWWTQFPIGGPGYPRPDLPPGLSTPGNCGPYPPGCSPCPETPNQALARQLAYEMACAQGSAVAQRGLFADAAKRAPQVALPFNSRGAGVVAPGVLANASVTISVSPSVPLCLTKLSFSRVTSPFFVVTALTSGMETYISDGQGFPTDSFAPDAEDIPPISLPTVYPGTQVSITLLNITSEPHEVWGMYWGLRLSKPGPCLG